MEAKGFRTQRAFRAWLERNGRTTAELIVRCCKVHAQETGITYAQALDEALCYGWIDGIRRSLDSDSFAVRFTPRKPTSIWSKVNVAHVERLMAEGHMAQPGLDAFARRTPERTGAYSFERQATLAPELLSKFKANRDAWEYYSSRGPGYRRTTADWVMSAKQAVTRERRLAALIECSGRREPIPQLDRRPRGSPGTHP
jgi:uncharacterized protein YdeI (YjbR/CyaY-like superfamily)